MINLLSFDVKETINCYAEKRKKKLFFFQHNN